MKRLKVQIAIAVAAALLLVACNTSWITTAQALLPVATSMANGVYTAVLVFQNKTITPQDLQAIQNISNQVATDLTEVGTLIQAYNTSPSPTTLGKINAAIQAAITTENTLLTSLHISDPATVSKVTAIVQIVTSEIQGIEAIIPIVQNGRVTARHAALAQVKKNKALYDPPTVKADWNAKIQELGLNPAAQIH